MHSLTKSQFYPSANFAKPQASKPTNEIFFLFFFARGPQVEASRVGVECLILLLMIIKTHLKDHGLPYPTDGPTERPSASTEA